jgi:DNA-binding transcriptional MerR regulator
MKIGEISAQTGVSQRMIRHFESLNLLTPDRLGKYRIYSDRESKLIKRIKELQELGLSLKEIKSILERPEQVFEENLLWALSRNRQQISDLESKNTSILKSLQSITLNSSLEKLSKERLIMEFIKSFEEKNVVRGRMPYLEVFYETFVHLSGIHWEFCPIKDLHSTDLMHIHEGVSKINEDDLKVLVSSEEQQFRNAFVFFLSPELLKTITGQNVSIPDLEKEKELNLTITSWVNEAIKTLNHSWNATFTKIELENHGILERNDDIKQLYSDDEIFIITNMYTENKKERFSVGLPYRFVSIVYNLLKR